MANEFFTILTATGRSKLAHAAANGTPLTLTHMAVGSGNNGAYYNPSEAQTALKKEVWRGPLNHLDVAQDNPNWIVAELSIPDNVGGFYIREVGLFDKAGNMIAVGRFPESYKPNVADGSNKQLHVRMILEVANTSAITLLVDTNIAIANRQYVDSKLAEAMQTLDRKQSARAATTGHITLSGLQTVDGINLVAGDRILVKNQNFAGDNGIYVAATEAWVRATDADTSAKVTPGLSLPVEEGTENADTIWMLVTNGAITIGTTPLEFDWVGRRNLAPITSPAFNGVPTAPTPAQFDASAKLATTEFVKKHGLEASGVSYFNTSTILDTSHIGGGVYAYGSNPLSFSLPQVSVARVGARIEIWNTSSQTLTIQRQGTDPINIGGLVLQSFKVTPNDNVFFECAGGAWFVIGGSAMAPYSSLFSASLAYSGYQKLPSGLILQWGSGLFASGTSVSFPITFPNACLHVIIGPSNFDKNLAAYQKVAPVAAYYYTTSGFTASSTTGISLAGEWLAIGY